MRQFHVHKNGDESSVLLGKFNEDHHRKWLAANPDKRHKLSPKESDRRLDLWQLYDEGVKCELTGRPRHTIVKMSCMTKSTVAHQSQLYLLEPATCEYVLSVESPLICDLLWSVDTDGVVLAPDSSAVV